MNQFKTRSYLSSGLSIRLSCRPNALSEELGSLEQGVEAIWSTTEQWGIEIQRNQGSGEQYNMVGESCINSQEEDVCATVFCGFIRGKVSKTQKVHEFLPSLASDVSCKVCKFYFYFARFIRMDVDIPLLTLDWIWICVGL